MNIYYQMISCEWETIRTAYRLYGLRYSFICFSKPHKFFSSGANVVAYGTGQNG
jgi:hypothetical protein